jgi:hypothetical protein
MSYLPWLSLAVLAAACGPHVPAPQAHDTPTAPEGAAAYRINNSPVMTTTDVSCELLAGDNSGNVWCTFSGVHGAGVDGGTPSFAVAFAFAHPYADQPEGAVLRSRAEFTIWSAGTNDGWNGVGGDDSNWDGTLTLTLGPTGSPRAATLDGALSVAYSINGSPLDGSSATFNHVPLVLP